MFEYEYFEGGAIDQAYSDLRRRNEPVVEITQTKGTSETHPALSPNDEWAGFEIMPYRVSTSIASEPPGSYVRNAFRRGLTIEAGGVSNPYKLGVIGSSDTHVAAGSFDEETYWGASGLMQATGEQRGSLPSEPAGAGASLQNPTGAAEPIDDGTGRIYPFTTAITNGASGLAAVWANENTRESIFDAMRRKETFGTSGTRIQVRFFGGAELSGLDIDDPDLVAAAYEAGVAMGGDLTGESGSEAPSFLVWAMQDTMAAPLQRVQIVKGWESGGETAEQVYDVACSDGLEVDAATHRCPDNGATVDLTDCSTSTGVGAAELKTIWTDPAFDPGQRAFYYARVPREPHLPLVELGRPASRYSSPPGLPGNHPGTRLVVADLVHALDAAVQPCRRTRGAPDPLHGCPHRRSRPEALRAGGSAGAAPGSCRRRSGGLAAVRRVSLRRVEREEGALRRSDALCSEFGIRRVEFDADVLAALLFADNPDRARAKEGVEHPVSRAGSSEDAGFDQSGREGGEVSSREGLGWYGPDGPAASAVDSRPRGVVVIPQRLGEQEQVLVGSSWTILDALRHAVRLFPDDVATEVPARVPEREGNHPRNPHEILRLHALGRPRPVGHRPHRVLRCRVRALRGYRSCSCPRG